MCLRLRINRNQRLPHDLRFAPRPAAYLHAWHYTGTDLSGQIIIIGKFTLLYMHGFRTIIIAFFGIDKFTANRPADLVHGFVSAQPHFQIGDIVNLTDVQRSVQKLRQIALQKS